MHPARLMYQAQPAAPYYQAYYQGCQAAPAYQAYQAYRPATVCNDYYRNYSPAYYHAYQAAPRWQGLQACQPQPAYQAVPVYQGSQAAPACQAYYQANCHPYYHALYQAQQVAAADQCPSSGSVTPRPPPIDSLAEAADLLVPAGAQVRHRDGGALVKTVELCNLRNCLEAAKKEGKTLLVDFYATWCGPCKKAAPAIEEAARRLDKLNSHVEVIKVDVSNCFEEATQRYNVSAVPTIRLFGYGQVEGQQFSGAITTENLCEFVKRLSR